MWESISTDELIKRQNTLLRKLSMAPREHAIQLNAFYEEIQQELEMRNLKETTTGVVWDSEWNSEDQRGNGK